MAYILADGTVNEFKTSRGIDQGCLGSPILFAIGIHRALQRARKSLEEWACATGDHVVQAVQDIRFQSFLDDLSCLAAPIVAPTALRTLRDALRSIGLEVNLDKSNCWSPEG